MAVSPEPSRTASASGCPRSKWLWMFSMATVASSTRMPMASASPPSVIRLIVCPVSQSATTAAISASGMFNRTIDRAPPIAEEEQNHQPHQDGPQRPFAHNTPNGPGDVGRLIELESDVNVRGQDGLHGGHGRLHPADHAKCRGVGALRDQQVHGATAVHQRIAGGEVRAVLDISHVADIDGRLGAGSQRDRLQVVRRCAPPC